MKYLGLDVGEKIVGVASSDSGIVASPLPALEVDGGFMESLGEVIETEKPGMIVFGIPSHRDGSENGLVKEIKNLAEVIKHEFGVEVDFVDEYGTTKQAEKILRSSGVGNRDLSKYDDSMAAALILERYFIEKENGKGGQYRKTDTQL